MAKKLYEESRIAAIAEKIREKTGTDETYTTAEMPSGVEAVYEAGAASGGGNTEAAYNEGYADGQQAEHDYIWTPVEQHLNAGGGTANLFSGAFWTINSFRPRQSINVYNPYMLFRDSRIEADLPALLQELGIEIIIPVGMAMQYTFYNTQFTRLGTFDLSNNIYLNGTFQGSKKLVTIDKIICNKNTTFNSTFNELGALENITFEGELAKNGLNLQWSTKLSKASIQSVINVLSATTSGLTVTLSKTAKEAAFTADEWSALIATKPNWTISLA